MYINEKHYWKSRFFFVDLIFNKYITTHNKNFDIHLVNCDFKLVFGTQFYPHIQSEFHYINNILRLKIFLSNWNDYFCERGRRFSHNYEMNITTIITKRCMAYEYYLKQQMQMAELNLNMKISKSPHLMNALDRSVNHPLIRNYSRISFN